MQIVNRVNVRKLRESDDVRGPRLSVRRGGTMVWITKTRVESIVRLLTRTPEPKGVVLCRANAQCYCSRARIAGRERRDCTVDIDGRKLLLMKHALCDAD